MKREIRLLDALDEFAQGGLITHAVGLTYGYDGDLADERLWTPLVERFGVRHPLVIADGAVTRAGRKLGVHVLRTRRAAGLFHAKLFLAVRDRAVLVAVGSANLTGGGLGKNLELMTTLTCTAGCDVPRSVLESVLEFIEVHVRAGLLGRVDSRSLNVLDEILAHARLVAADMPEKTRGARLRFVHSYSGAILPQLRAIHGDDVVRRLVVVSPFFENEGEVDQEDSSLLQLALGDGLPWAARPTDPRAILHVASVEEGSLLPVRALQGLGTAVALRVQSMSKEPRRLHAKLLALIGRKGTTLFWGSANFTPAALLRPASAGGNVECGLVATTVAADLDIETVEREFDLTTLFRDHAGALPEPGSRPLSIRPLFEVGEAIYDPRAQQLVVAGEVFDATVRRLVILREDRPEDLALPLLALAIADVGPFHVEGAAGHLEAIDADTGRRTLDVLTIVVVARDSAGRDLARLTIRLNVQFDDALELRDNLLLGAEALRADALLLPVANTPEQRVADVDRLIAAWKAARAEHGIHLTPHVAALDVFYRNVRRGLDARWASVRSRRGARFALLQWSHALRRALRAVDEVTLDAPRRLYLADRVAVHIAQVLDALPAWHAAPAEVYGVLQGPDLAALMRKITLDGDAVLEGNLRGTVDAVRARRDATATRLEGLR